MSTDDERQARIAEIKHRHRTVTENVVWAGICVACDEQEPCDAMTLLSELDVATARAERAERERHELIVESLRLIDDNAMWKQGCERLRAQRDELRAALAAAQEARDE